MFTTPVPLTLLLLYQIDVQNNIINNVFKIYFDKNNNKLKVTLLLLLSDDIAVGTARDKSQLLQYFLLRLCNFDESFCFFVPISSQCSHSLNHILFSHLLSRFILCGALTPAFSVKLSGIYRTTADDCNFISSYSDSEAERVRRLKLTQIVEFFNLLLQYLVSTI